MKMGKKFTVIKRREIISTHVLEKGFASVEDLMELVHVSRMTIHRDLDELERLQIIRKVRNGASAQPSSLFESDFRYRASILIEEKEAMCKLASSLIEDGISIYLDDSTTVLPIIKYLKNKSLTIISACIPIINETINVGTLDLIVLGGNYNSKFRSNFGRICISTIEKLHPDLSIMSSVAYTNGAVFQSEQCILTVKRAMLNHSEKKMLLMDHTKFDITALYHLAKISEFDYVIVDNRISKEHNADIKTYNDNLYIAQV